MTRFVVGIVMLLQFVTAGAFANEAQRLALAREILSGANSSFENALTVAIAPIVEELAKSEPQKAAEYEKHMREALAGLGDRYLNEMAAAMAGKFTEQELTQFLEFQRSALGEKMAQFASPANKEVVAIGKKYFMEMMAFVAMSGAGLTSTGRRRQ